MIRKEMSVEDVFEDTTPAVFSAVGPGGQHVSDLVARCIAGDLEAQALFYTNYNGLVERAVTRKWLQVMGARPRRADVEDIRNEVFTQLLGDRCRKLGTLHNPKAIDAWMMTVAGNHTIDHLRRQSRADRLHASMVEEVRDAYVESPDQVAMAREAGSCVHAGLAELPVQDRLILELFFLQGLKYAEIAEVVGLNINTAAARLRRAKCKLRSQLKGEWDELA